MPDTTTAKPDTSADAEVSRPEKASSPYTGAELDRLEHDLELLNEAALALEAVVRQAPSARDANLDDEQVRAACREVFAVQRLLTERASAGAIAEQVAIARMVIGGCHRD